jgi:hypothetical protein
MYWSDALGAAIEVAIGIAGFSGIVAAVGRRGAGDWTSTDQLRLRVLLTASGFAGAFAFVPFILLDTGLDAHLFWRLGTGAQIAFLIAIPLYRRRQTTQLGATYLGGVMPYSYPVFLALYVPTLGILVFNTAVLGAPWPYVVGIFLILYTAFHTFVRLLLDSWRTQA